MKNTFFKFLHIIVGALSVSYLLASSITLNASDIDKFEIENNLKSCSADVLSRRSRFTFTWRILKVILRYI